MGTLGENSTLMTYSEVKLQLVKVQKLDVCGSLVLSNPVTYKQSSGTVLLMLAGVIDHLRW